LKILFWLYLATISISAIDISQKYPSYSYVFGEFDIDSEYIYDEGFNKFVEIHHKEYKRFYDNSIRRGGYLATTFKSMLIQNGLSDLFLYLSMVESGLKLDALSPKSATGVWQFMRQTAKEYNLSVDSNFDERLDPILSTNAAIEYLHKLHHKFGKWYLAMMAYNCGEGRLQKGINRAKSDNIATLTDSKARYIPKETRLYIYKILLLSMIGENISLGFTDEGIEYLYDDEIVQVEVDAGENIDSIAKLIEMKPKKLRELNHHFKSGTIPALLPYYMINIPLSKIVDFYTLYMFKKEIDKSPKNHLISHIVRGGETIKLIATRYSTTIGEIISTNRLKAEALKEGDILIIPVSEDIFNKWSNIAK
jgi:membrane-bound lytic murein transglycosylase D